MVYALTPEQAQEVVRLYVDEGLTLKEVGKRMHIERTTVIQYLERAGVPRRPRGGCRHNTPVEDDILVINWLYWGMGFDLEETARALGLSPSTVRNRMVRHGIPRRPPHIMTTGPRLSDAERARRSQRAKEMWANGVFLVHQRKPAT